MINKIINYLYDNPTKNEIRFTKFVVYGISIIVIQQIICAF